MVILQDFLSYCLYLKILNLHDHEAVAKQLALTAKIDSASSLCAYKIVQLHQQNACVILPGQFFLIEVETKSMTIGSFLACAENILSLWPVFEYHLDSVQLIENVNPLQQVIRFNTSSGQVIHFFEINFLILILL